MSRNKRLGSEEKVNIVRKWKAGEISIRAASQEAGAALETIRRWIARYEAEGAAGFFATESKPCISAGDEAAGRAGVSVRGG